MENQESFDNIKSNNMSECCNRYYDEYGNSFPAEPSPDHYKHYVYTPGNNDFGFNQEYYGDMSQYLNLDCLEASEYEDSSPTAEKSKRARVDEDSLIQIFMNNGICYGSKEDVNRILNKIRETYSWTPGFCLQLGSKGRKAMLQLLRKAYRSCKKNKRVFQNKKPPSTISNLPFFKISMLWELAYELGVLDQAILIHEIFGNDKKKFVTAAQASLKLVQHKCTHEHPHTNTSSTFDQRMEFLGRRCGNKKGQSQGSHEGLEHKTLVFSHKGDFATGMGMDEVERSPNRSALMTKDDFVAPLNDGYVPPVNEYRTPARGPFVPRNPAFGPAPLDGQDTPYGGTGLEWGKTPLYNKSPVHYRVFGGSGAIKPGDYASKSCEQGCFNPLLARRDLSHASPSSLSTDVPPQLDDQFFDDEPLYSTSSGCAASLGSLSDHNSPRYQPGPIRADAQNLLRPPLLRPLVNPLDPRKIHCVRTQQSQSDCFEFVASCLKIDGNEY